VVARLRAVEGGPVSGPLMSACGERGSWAFRPCNLVRSPAESLVLVIRRTHHCLQRSTLLQGQLLRPERLMQAFIWSVACKERLDARSVSFEILEVIQIGANKR
jgi:hypothetical protein